ncbi:DNA mismatch repair protein MutS [Aureibaculum sp. 2210JD6-5]|uniref:endonuclease MutS2 n=1 Tax=Aureibaculum sp. 2210JD6-5 TaxID=3103957 RepID=UPI002AAE0D23|nr:DNA mismatch repair protein MutS [Aureibaculum sp. 2210JD6-5]MDY7396589.1 DNA mismatch repair protein MutS [Aureibaculum sp. 2210JD6-5]
MSSKITNKTLKDLEFDIVLNRIANYCHSSLGKKAVLEIEPIRNKQNLVDQLHQTNEYLASFISDNRIPNHQFDEITKEIHLLGIENSFLEAQAFQKVAAVSETTIELLIYFKKFAEYFPALFKASQNIEHTKVIHESIHKIINRFGEVSDNASTELKAIRKEMNSVRGEIGNSFTKALNHYAANDYLDDIKESVIDNQRVLAVLSMHRKKVKGSLLGNSKTGSIVYIAPEATLKLSRKLQDLIYEEQQEVVRILKMLTDQISPYKNLLEQFQLYLTHLDLVLAKTKYAQKINGLLPKISNEKKVLLRDAYHPILLESNTKKKIDTVPQTLELNQNQQIIVISGPNAGGKSITLKTIGLLQVMIQSAILIPVHERSEVYFFDTILTDIGDNQSIENQLSTYSYRLKNMRNFLRKCDENTLFLIDEFGTGSDPELGGALAEIFLEEFYNKNAYGVITTHYSNLKVLANELENVTNANMQFDERTLEPLFKLFIGQAGSSFTFEVAQKNGIPFSLINRAKKKVERGKIRLDKTISKLQKERNKLQRTSDNLEKEQDKAKAHTDNLSEKELKIQEKLESFQELYDNNQKMLSIGRKINEMSNTYFQSNNKKKLLSDFMKWILIEKNKYATLHEPQKKTKVQKKKEIEVKKTTERKLKEVNKEVLIEVKKIREKKNTLKKQVEKTKADYTFKVNDRVRLPDGKSVGTIDKIEKNIATINYGLFTTKVNTNQLELVEAAKK